jgi:hypothetical protein
MIFARVVQDRSTGRRWLEIPLPADVDDEDDRALVGYVRRFFDAVERQWNLADEQIRELEQLYKSDGAA